MKQTFFLIKLALVLTACTGLPESFTEIKWQDLRGDRGLQVMKRDFAWCSVAVETRRSLHEQCMIERGWASAK